MGIDVRYLRKELNDYTVELIHARLSERIPGFWVMGADHFTYQTRDPHNFDIALEHLSPYARQITCIEHSGPFEVAIRLLGPLVISKQSRVEWLRLKEIDRQQEDPVWEGISALNILVDSLDTIKKRLLTQTNLDAAAENDRIEVKINDRGQSYNFVEVPLWELTEQRLEEGSAIPIFPITVNEPGSVRHQEG